MKTAGDQGVRRGDRAPRRRRAGRRAHRRTPTSPGVGAIRGTAAARARPRSSPGPILGTVGPVTAEIIKQNPGVYQRRRRGRPVRPRGSGTTSSCAAPRGSRWRRVDARASRASSTAPHHSRGRRSAPPSTPRLQSLAERIAGEVRSGQRARRDPAVDRRPRSPRPTGPERTAINARPWAASRPARRSRWSPPWRCCAAGSSRRRPSTARRSVTVNGKRVQELQLLPAGGLRPHHRWHRAFAELLQHRLHQRAHRLGLPRTCWPRRRGARHRRRPRPRLPGVLRRRCRADVRDRTRPPRT